MLYACDLTWWERYIAEVRATTKAELWTLSRSAGARYGVRVIGSARGDGLSTKPGVINTGGNSGFQVVGLAHQAEAARIILLGYDMGRTGGKSHWHGDHPKGLGNGNNFKVWVRRFARMAPGLVAAGIEVVNASRVSALTCFPRMSLQDALR